MRHRLDGFILKKRKGGHHWICCFCAKIMKSALAENPAINYQPRHESFIIRIGRGGTAGADGIA